MTGVARICWWILLTLSALLTLIHVVLTFTMDDPVLFSAFAAANAIAVVVLWFGYRAGLGWAWWAVWIEIALVASVGLSGDDTGLRVSFAAIGLVMAVAQLGTMTAVTRRVSRQRTEQAAW